MALGWQSSPTLDVVSEMRGEISLKFILFCCFCLQRHFAEVSTKYIKFQRPVDFDTKLTHVKRLLDDIDQRIHLVDLTSVDLDSVDSKLEQCTVSISDVPFTLSSLWRQRNVLLVGNVFLTYSVDTVM